MPVQGKPRSYHKKFLFSIEVDGLDIAWFSKCSEIAAEVAVVEQFEGGKINVANQSPGHVKWSPVTLEAGCTDNEDLYNWFEQVVDSESDTGEPDDSFKRNLAIVQRDRDGKELKRWDCYETWPSKFVGGDWDAKADENTVESVTLCIKRAKKSKAA